MELITGGLCRGLYNDNVSRKLTRERRLSAIIDDLRVEITHCEL